MLIGQRAPSSKGALKETPNRGPEILSLREGVLGLCNKASDRANVSPIARLTI